MLQFFKKTSSPALADKLGYAGPISTGLPHACCLDLYSLVHQEFLYSIRSYQMTLLSPMLLCKQTESQRNDRENLNSLCRILPEPLLLSHFYCWPWLHPPTHPPAITMHYGPPFQSVGAQWTGSIWVTNFHFLIELFLRDSLEITLNAFS